MHLTRDACQTLEVTGFPMLWRDGGDLRGCTVCTACFLYYGWKIQLSKLAQLSNGRMEVKFNQVYWYCPRKMDMEPRVYCF